MPNDTIAALATPPGAGAIAIVDRGPATKVGKRESGGAIAAKGGTEKREKGRV